MDIALQSVLAPGLEKELEDEFAKPDHVTLSPERRHLEQALNAAAQSDITGLIDVAHVEATIESLLKKAQQNLDRIEENRRSVQEQYDVFLTTSAVRAAEQQRIVAMACAALGVNPAPQKELPSPEPKAKRKS